MIKDQTIKILTKKYGVDLKGATDEEIVTFLEYFKLNGIAQLFSTLRHYDKHL